MNFITTEKEQLLKQVQQMPNLPGVYQMYGKQGDLLYIGKAKSLKNRVGSYFLKTIEHPKTQALVNKIHSIETIITRSETEALLLEQNLIKSHKPPFNIMLRDDKSYLYVFVSADKPFARLSYGRGKQHHKQGYYFGPYPSAASTKDTLLLLQKMFKVRQCENTFFKARQRPCLEYQIKRCKAPCVGLVSAAEYQEDVKHTLKLLQGENNQLQEELIQQMHDAAEQQAYEQAAVLRDQLSMLKQIQAQQAVYTFKGEADVFAIGEQAGVVAIHVITIRNGQMLGGKSYYPDMALEDTLADMLSSFMATFYFQVVDDTPSELIVSLKLDDEIALAEALSSHFNKKIIIKNNVRETRAQWLNLAQINVENALKTKLSSQLELFERFRQLQEIVGIPVNSMECFDISHTQGEATVASCVVFDQGGARKRDYRQYAIKDITAGDDYAAMHQALMRRYQKFALPDLLIIDGGKGQLTMAKKAMQDLNLNAQILGVSKGEGRKAGLETLHLPNGQAIQLPNDNKALHLIQQIRDEAHRFAIKNHRAKRDKKRAGSVLEIIPGLGPMRRRALLAHFGGLQQLLGASQQEIAQVNGLGEHMAKQIYKVLHE